MTNVVCQYCNNHATLVDGSAIYPHRADLYELKFWSCQPCNAYVGCHKKGAWFWQSGVKKTSDGTIPLGRLANANLRRAKSAAHAAFDPIWRCGQMSRKNAYALLATKLNIDKDDCHIGMMDEIFCYKVVEIAKEMELA